MAAAPPAPPLLPPAPVPPEPAPPSAVPAAPRPALVGTVAAGAATGDWLHRRAVEALTMISYPWPLLGYKIVFDTGRVGIRARVLLSERRIEVYVRPTDSAGQTAFDLAHEMAHAFDFTFGNGALRTLWQEARHIHAEEPWFGCNACDDLATPAGDFAESFAAWQVPGGDYRSRLGPPPDGRQKALLDELTSL